MTSNSPVTGVNSCPQDGVLVFRGRHLQETVQQLDKDVEGCPRTQSPSEDVKGVLLPLKPRPVTHPLTARAALEGTD